MRAKEAKQIPIQNYLESNGFNPAKARKNNELWYHSPIRQGDSTPSFKVNTDFNIWYDHGISEGGDLIDLVCKLQNATVSQALSILESSNIGASNFVNIQSVRIDKNFAVEKEKNGSPSFDVHSIKDITSPSLLDYLDSRCISHHVALKYLKEVNFSPKESGKNYYALGLPSGDGFEVRSPFFKGFVGTRKDIFKYNLNDGNSISIFEGFFDYLAFLTFYKINEFENSVIILNSTNLKERALELIGIYDFSKVYLFLDNDTPGQICTDYFKENIDGVEIVDKSDLYLGFKDFNEMLVSCGKG